MQRRLSYCGLGRSTEAQLGSKVPSVQFGTETVSASDHSSRSDFSSDLSLDKHVASVCSSGFHWLRQLRLCRMILRLGLHKDARPRLHCILHGLLQCHSSQITSVYD